MNRLLVIIVAASALVVPGTALAQTTLWGGTTGTPGGEPVSGIQFQSIQLGVASGRVRVNSVQAVMSCTNTEDGLVSPVAFWAVNSPRVALRRNRFTLNFPAEAGGRDGVVRLTGLLGTNGRGTVRLNLTATAVDSDRNLVIERCVGAVTYQVRRGRPA